VNASILDRSTADILANLAEKYQIQYVNCDFIIAHFLRNDAVMDLFIKKLSNMFADRSTD